MRQPDVEKNHVFSVPTLPSAKVSGMIVHAELVGGGGVEELTVQPDNLAEVGLADPSLTSTVQSAGAVKPLLSILKRPAPSLVPMATPSTVIVRLGLACPSIRSCVPLSSAREIPVSTVQPFDPGSSPARPQPFTFALIHPTSGEGNSPKFAAFRGFSGKLASPGTFIADSSPLTMVVEGWVYRASSSFSFPELLVGFLRAHPSLLPLFSRVRRR